MDLDGSDDELLEALRDALTTAEEVPQAFVEAGKAAFVWRTIDAELAALRPRFRGRAGPARHAGATARVPTRR